MIYTDCLPLMHIQLPLPICTILIKLNDWFWIVSLDSQLHSFADAVLVIYNSQEINNSTIKPLKVMPMSHLFILFNEEPLIDTEEPPDSNTVLLAKREAHLIAILQLALWEGIPTQQFLFGVRL